MWLLATSRRVAGEGAGEAPHGTPRRRADCPKAASSTEAFHSSRKTGTFERSPKLPASILYLGRERTDRAPFSARSQHVGIVECFRVFSKRFRGLGAGLSAARKGEMPSHSCKRHNPGRLDFPSPHDTTSESCSTLLSTEVLCHTVLRSLYITHFRSNRNNKLAGLCNPL
jgi:hypothetical protein